MISIYVRRKYIDLFSKNSYVLCKFHVAFSTSTEKQPLKTTTAVESLLLKHNFSPKTVSKAASALRNLKNTEKSESIIYFLIESGFSMSQMENLVKCRPRLLLSSLETTIKPKFKILQGLGYSENELSEWIANNPWILKRGKNAILHSLSLLKGFVGSDNEVGKLVRISNWFLSSNLVKRMNPNVEFLMGCGIPLQQIVRLMYNFPRFLLTEPHRIRKSVEKAEAMGVRRGSKMFVHAVRVVNSLSNKTWEIKFLTFQDLGFSEVDIFRAFRQVPTVFLVSEKKMRRIKEVVVGTGKYDFSCIINNPRALGHSIENWFKPRLQVLRVLETKNLIADWPSFTVLRSLPNWEFFRRFVAPYLDEVGVVYGKTVAVKVKREVKHVAVIGTEVIESSGNLI